ncbi:uncharacterized protein LOC107042846 [Diachasma alloeum]|uniref:uncharacterized protein LOC107042846 n=1 Tax=Diachasma alloeum TaxID=454923 RepID=UPI0007383F7A|nr:uncharacterized protein LOC107042846 [Diachasma alloeum]
MEEKKSRKGNSPGRMDKVESAGKERKNEAGDVRKRLVELEGKHPSIKFTMEIEQNGCLPFLDVLVRRNKDGTMGHHVYRKPTHTERYLDAASHHHPSQKNSVISSLMYRARTISQPSKVNSEVEHLETALTKNGYIIQ